jgi:hypothetical protein
MQVVREKLYRDLHLHQDMMCHAGCEGEVVQEPASRGALQCACHAGVIQDIDRWILAL